jgi:HAD superfamily hydrolase (TIGR01450 family)
MLQVESFFEIARRYRVVFFDAYGVLKNATGTIPGALDAIHRLQSVGVDCHVVSNDASRSPERMVEAYVHPQHGRLIAPEKNISSGMLASEFLSAKVRPGGRVAYLGKPASAHYIETAGLIAVPLSECAARDDLDALVFLDDEGFDWFRDINLAVNLLRRTNIPVVVANADVTYPVRDGEVALAVGSLANMVQQAVAKTFVVFGKPDVQIFSFAYARVRAEHAGITKRDVLMVGDTLHTDVLGANKFGLDTVLVLSGNTERHAVEALVAASGIIPSYICEAIST